MEYPKMYKRATTGVVLEWWMEREDERYRTHSGQLGGSIVTTDWTVAEAKNVGSSNETRPVDQAHREVLSKYEAKESYNGYCKDIKDIDTPKFFAPMLAKKWTDRRNRISYPIYIQPKFDGIRCVCQQEGLFSRRGKAHVN
jgi:ATP-dependent DNA ligase